MDHEQQTREMVPTDAPTRELQTIRPSLRILVAVPCPECEGRSSRVACQVCMGSRELIQRMELNDFREVLECKS